MRERTSWINIGKSIRASGQWLQNRLVGGAQRSYTQGCRVFFFVWENERERMDKFLRVEREREKCLDMYLDWGMLLIPMRRMLRDD